MLSINLFNPNQPRINFGFGIVFDNGASTNQGSYKGSIVSGEGKAVGNVVNNVVCIDGVKSTDDYLKGLGKNIAITAILNHSAIMQLPESDRNIDYVVGFPPTQTVKNKATVIANLRGENGESLKDVDYNDLLEKGYISQNLDKVVISSNKSGKEYKDIDAGKFNSAEKIDISKDCKLVVTNDMVGAIAYVTNILLNSPKYQTLMKEGTNFVYIMPGGGMGIGFAEFGKDNKVIIKASECGHIKEPDSNKTIEAGGVSSPALIQNFAEELGLSYDDVKKVVDTRNGRIVTDFETSKTELKKLLDLDLDKENYSKAANKAVDRLINDIAYVCSIKVLEGFNFAVISGPIMGGINKYMNGNFDQILTQRILDNLVDDRGKAQFYDNNFRVITDISVPDNTLGGRFLPNGQFIGENRGNWFEIAKENLLN